MKKKICVVGNLEPALKEIMPEIRDAPFIQCVDYEGLIPTPTNLQKTMNEDDLLAEGYDRGVPELLERHFTPTPSETDSVTSGYKEVTLPVDSVFLNEENVKTNFIETMYDSKLEVLKEFGIEYTLKVPGEFYLSDIINVLKEVSANGKNVPLHEGDLWIIIYKNLGTTNKPYRDVCEKGTKYPIKLSLLDARYAFKVKGDIQFNGFGFLSIIASYLSDPFRTNTNIGTYATSAAIEMGRWLDERGLWNEVTRPLFTSPSISLHSKMQLFGRIKDYGKTPNLDALKLIVARYMPEIR